MNRVKVKRVAALVAAAACCAMPARAKAAAGLDGFIAGNYPDTLALIPVKTLLGLLALIVSIDNYIRPNLKWIMRVVYIRGRFYCNSPRCNSTFLDQHPQNFLFCGC